MPDDDELIETVRTTVRPTAQTPQASTSLPDDAPTVSRQRRDLDVTSARTAWRSPAPPDDRLSRMFEDRGDEFRRYGRAQRRALETAERSLSYDDLDVAANRLARYLRGRRLGPGDRMGILLDDPTDALVAQLAVAKLGAVWVPLAPALTDPGIAAVVEAAGVGVVLTTGAAERRLSASEVDAVYLDRIDSRVRQEGAQRLPAVGSGPHDDAPAYIVVYADEPGGGLRAPAIGRQAVTQLVRVVAELTGIGVGDRVLHDPSLASDLAVLETWVPWSCGATVVTPPAGTDRQGEALGRFLRDRRVTVLRADPELLDGIDVDLPDLRLVLFTGARPGPELIGRWERRGRRLIGLHGPPEATVAALWSELRSQQPATLGRPLPGYGVVVLGADDPTRELGPGEIGEVGITGPGVARGYVGRPDLTRAAFVDGGRRGIVFRTGELGRLTADDDVERIARLEGAAGRGTRVPPWQARPPRRPDRPRRSPRTQIVHLPPRRPHPPPTTALRPPPSVLPPRRSEPPRTDPRPDTPTATPMSGAPPAAPSGDTVEIRAALAGVLATVLGRDAIPADAHFFDDLGADSLLMARFCAHVRKHPQLPTVAMQDVYQNPTLSGLAAAMAPAAPAASSTATATVQAELATILAEVLGRADIPPDAHFFDDLGADSLMMARFCARVRKRPDLPTLAMPDIYAHPTLASLAASAAPAANAAGPPPPAPTAGPAASGPRAGTAAFVACGIAQVLFVASYTLAVAVFVTWAYERVVAATGALDLYVRAVSVAATGLVALAALPVVLKWLLVGRWRPGTIRVWSVAYLRFWIVKVLIRTSPMVMFTGTPAFSLYLRALGASIAPGVVLLTRQVPVATDLFRAGRGTLVRKDSIMSGYRAHDGRIEIGGVDLGENVVVGEATVLDVRTSMGDGARLSHTSSLHPGQHVPAWETWHGSPGRRSEIAAPTVPPAACGRLRRALYPAATLAFVLLVALPAMIGAFAVLHSMAPHIEALLEPPPGAITTGAHWAETALLSAVLYFGGLALGLALVATLPRLLALGLRPDVVYPLYGVRYWLHRSVSALTNVKGFVELFGDSSAVAYYLMLVGYRLRPLTQTGSNFGMTVKHENPFLTTVGRETVVADGLSVMNAEYSPTSFRLSRTSIGARNFLGNNIAYPPQGRTGDDCLLATKVAVPVVGPVRSGVGLLGSPSFEIPRTVARDSDLDTADPAELAAALRRKNRHNAVTIALHLLARWLFGFLVLVAVAVVAALPIRLGALEVLIAQALILVLTITWFVLVERTAAGLKALAPQGCSIYDREFWRHERYWKVPSPNWMRVFDGTPFKSWIWRLLGVRIGKRVFDDGAAIIERGFTRIGDDCTLGEGAVIQCHSQEDGAFKSDLVVIGARCTLGVASFIHYGTTIGDDAIIEPDTFLMKGEEVPARSHWGGNPARQRPDR